MNSEQVHINTLIKLIRQSRAQYRNLTDQEISEKTYRNII